jgi:hypothetical protein
VDWLTFIAKTVESVAWPAVLVGILIWLRKPLEALVATIRIAKYKDIELSFGKKLEELEGKAEKAGLPEPKEPPAWVYESPDDWTFGDYIERLSPISPRAAITEAWRHVEVALKEAARRIGKGSRLRPVELARFLHQEGRLPRDAVGLVDDLRALRNQAVHADDGHITPDRAIEFGRLAERVIASISVQEPQPPRDQSRNQES